MPDEKKALDWGDIVTRTVSLQPNLCVTQGDCTTESDAALYCRYSRQPRGARARHQAPSENTSSAIVTRLDGTSVGTTGGPPASA